MSMSPDVTMDKNTEDQINRLENEVEELQDQVATFKLALVAIPAMQFVYNSALDYLECELIDALEDADKGWDRAREIAVELANAVKTIEKYKQLFDETNAVFKKLGI